MNILFNQKPINRRTIRRTLRRRGLIPKTSSRGKEIVQKNRDLRLKLALNFVNWGLQEWGSVVFTDESTIFPKRMKSRVIWSQRGCHHHTDEEPNIKRLGIQVWAFITGVMVKKIFYGGGGARGKKTLLKKTFCMNPDQPGNWRSRG